MQGEGTRETDSFLISKGKWNSLSDSGAEWRRNLWSQECRDREEAILPSSLHREAGTLCNSMVIVHGIPGEKVEVVPHCYEWVYSWDHIKILRKWFENVREMGHYAFKLCHFHLFAVPCRSTEGISFIPLLPSRNLAFVFLVLLFLLIYTEYTVNGSVLNMHLICVFREMYFYERKTNWLSSIDLKVTLKVESHKLIYRLETFLHLGITALGHFKVVQCN